MDDKEILHAGIDDIPSDVFNAGELEEGGTIVARDLLVYNNTPILNQSLSVETRMACGAYSISKCNNEMNFLEGVYPQNNCDPAKFWNRTVSQYAGTISG